ncbi:MAG: nucleoside triphosphate pyrophosphohydrolase [Bacteroidetes bacterium]|nr:nucleoside triphosphate pyrophosphohydrolase [Bacteroidota bacterium]
MKQEEKIEAFGKLLTIMDELREKCPWDREQTNESLRKLTIEEVYELGDAVLENNAQEIKKELGDIMLHIVFYAKIGEEQGQFDVGDVINNLIDKLIYRHPHVFGTTEAKDSDQVVRNWETLKLKEKGRGKRVLEGVPMALPALIKANRIQEKVRGVGFDWEYKEQVWDKVKEELGELEVEFKAGRVKEMENEFGDVLFSIVNMARLYGIDPESALERTNQKFIRRFNYLEEKTLLIGKSLQGMTLEEMDVYWNEAKRLEKPNF